MKDIALLISFLLVFSCSNSTNENQEKTNQIMLNYEAKVHSSLFLIDTLINIGNYQDNSSKIHSIVNSLIKTTDSSIALVKQKSEKDYLLKNKKVFKQIIKSNSIQNKDSLNTYTYKWRKLSLDKNKPKEQENIDF